MKKLINQPESVVREMCEGFLAIYPGMSLLSHHNVLLRSDAHRAFPHQVALISGGGSGHEPAHAGYVGQGMLTAAVAGEVFTSPSVESVLASIRAVTGSAGALLIVKNYTGDRLNFGLAAEMARAAGILIETVIVADDVALAGRDDHAGRRGLAGTVLIHKIAGAAAAEGKDLPQVAAIAQAAADSLGTMGVSLSAGTSPAVGKPSFTLGEQEMELGLGIHGEPGVRRVRLLTADEAVDQMLSSIVASLRLGLKERVAVLVNNLGATTAMELAIVARRVVHTLRSRGLVVERLYGGTFLSSFDMAGVSLSVLRLDEERLRLLDADTLAPAWPHVLPWPPDRFEKRTVDSAVVRAPLLERRPRTALGQAMEQAIRAACEALVAAESRLTELDRIAGDGDLGVNLRRGSEAVKEALLTYTLDEPAEALRAIGMTLQQSLGGSSGPLYGVLLLRAGSSLEGGSGQDAARWATAILDGCEAISELGDARVGDRTMLDALVPFARTFQSELADNSQVMPALLKAVSAADAGAEQTRTMVARRGRSSYLGERTSGTPDPGAAAVAIWLRAVVSVLAEL